jgi:hypothetical protein
LPSGLARPACDKRTFELWLARYTDHQFAAELDRALRKGFTLQQ